MGRGDFSLPARSRFGEGRSPLSREAKASPTRNEGPKKGFITFAKLTNWIQVFHRKDGEI